MARTNKYTSVNFNDIYDKKFSNTNTNTNTNTNPLANPNNTKNSSSNGRSKTIISNSRIQGNMLVLSRPTPKPISIPVPIPQQLSQKHSSLDSKDKKRQDQPASQPDKISLRPQGRTGAAPSLVSSASAPISPSGSAFKTNKFVPPHLRPGFVGKEEKPVGPPGRGVVAPGVQRQGHGYGENGRPTSGGGYERTTMMKGRLGINAAARGGGGDVGPGYFMNRPGPGGARPNTSG